jgi:hypothetical protein
MQLILSFTSNWTPTGAAAKPPTATGRHRGSRGRPPCLALGTPWRRPRPRVATPGRWAPTPGPHSRFPAPIGGPDPGSPFALPCPHRWRGRVRQHDWHAAQRLLLRPGHHGPLSRLPQDHHYAHQHDQRQGVQGAAPPCNTIPPATHAAPVLPDPAHPTPLQDDPTIMAWDLINEPVCKQCGPGRCRPPACPGARSSACIIQPWHALADPSALGKR